MMDFFDAWWWLYHHPINNQPGSARPDKTYPVGMYQLDIYASTTEREIWLEFGPFPSYEGAEYDTNDRMHDPRLDCGGKTFEEAIINLARLVKKYYGDYNEA